MFNKSFKMSAAAFENGASENGNRYGSGGFNNNIDPSKAGLEAWKPQEGKNLIDIIPFNADKKNPLVISGKAQEGEVLYSLDYFTHRDIGPSHSNITCLQQYGKDCPLCRENQRLFKAGNQDAASKVRSKRRVVYVVHDLIRDTFGYWDTAWNTVEKEITNEAKFEHDTDGGVVNVFDWHDGMSVEFMGTKSSWAGHEFIKPERFRFAKREPLTDAVLEKSVDLSTTVKLMEPEEMEAIISGKAVNSKPVEAPKVEEPVAKKVEDEMASVAAEALNQSFDDIKPVATPAKPAPAGDKVCPCGYTWGDADHHPECASCQVWDKCIGC